MCQEPRSAGWVRALAGAITLATAGPALAALFAIGRDSGNLYQVSTVDAALELIGNTGLQLGSLEMSPSGRLYGFTTGALPALYEIDPNTAAPTLVGPLGGALFVFEGGLAFGPDGTAYASNMGEETNDWLFSLNPLTGLAAAIAPLAGSHDINGLAWRSDGLLVGLDNAINALVTIHPTTGATAVLRDLSPLNRDGASILGANGGMAVLGGVGYFATAAAGATIPGSSELYSFNLFTGETQRVGAFSPALTGKGIGGLAAPEPAALLAVLMGMVSLGCRRRR